MHSIRGLSDRALLVILDGFGIKDDSLKNAIAAAKKPHLQELFAHYPFTTIEASGESVGLPNGVIGNSEVGHLNIGAGRPVTQDLVRINQTIANNSFKDLDKMIELIETAKKNSKRIHLMGLLSDGGVHSHIDHLKEIVRILSFHPELKIFFHAFMDGRDTPPKNGEKYLKECKTWKGLTIASMQGRSIGMDRDRRFEKIKKAYDTFIGNGLIKNIDPVEYLKSEYEKDITDEFITPVLFDKSFKIGKDDCVFFINYRPDRAIQMALAFNDPQFKEFDRPIIPAYYLCMTPYIDDQVTLPILFDKENISGGLSEYLSNKGFKQFKVAETEKFAHVTYFFNGGRREPFPGEDRKLVSSPKDVATYDLKPEMSSGEVTDNLLNALDNPDYKLIVVNYANPDMVGHTGNFEAAVKSIEAIDTCVGKVIKKCADTNVVMCLTSDHGNSDQMIYKDGGPHTSHTGSKVPFSLFYPSLKDQALTINEGPLALKDVAATITYLLGLEYPPTFVGRSIFK